MPRRAMPRRAIPGFRDRDPRLGRREQAFGLFPVEGTEGPEQGVRMVEARTGAGLSFWAMPSRCLDIWRAEFAGTPLAWLAPPGAPHPAHYEPEGMEWLRSMTGGLLMTCGLTQVGTPCEDEGESLGLHGRIHALPARQCSARVEDLPGGGAELVVEGVVEQARLFGEHLSLRRRISAKAGGNEIVVRDEIRNEGWSPSPLMLLYHFNFGWPLLSPGARLSLPSRRVRPRDEGTPLDGLDTWQDPSDGGERVYYHEDLAAEDRGGRPRAVVAIDQPEFPIAGGALSVPIRAELEWTADSLPRFVQWRMPGRGAHVLGIEPSNCWVSGRAAERAVGTLRMLEPGASESFELRFSIRTTA